MILKFGKHAGQDISTVPDDYINYMIRNSQDSLLMWQTELQRRKQKIDGSLMSRIVKEGFAVMQTFVDVDQTKLARARQLLDEAIANAASVSS